MWQCVAATTEASGTSLATPTTRASKRKKKKKKQKKQGVVADATQTVPATYTRKKKITLRRASLRPWRRRSKHPVALSEADMEQRMVPSSASSASVSAFPPDKERRQSDPYHPLLVTDNKDTNRYWLFRMKWFLRVPGSLLLLMMVYTTLLGWWFDDEYFDVIDGEYIQNRNNIWTEGITDTGTSTWIWLGTNVVFSPVPIRSASDSGQQEEDRMKKKTPHQHHPQQQHLPPH